LKYFLVTLLIMLVSVPAVNAGQKDSGRAGARPQLSDTTLPKEISWNFRLKGFAGFFPASYNRVDGLLAGWGFNLSAEEVLTIPGSRTRQAVPGKRYPEFSFELLVPTARSFVGGSLGVRQRLSGRKQVDLGLNLDVGGCSNDTWRSSDPGAALSYLVLGRDRRYYHERRGGEVFLGGNITRSLSVRLAFYHERIKSLWAADTWTVVSSRLLEVNPPVTHGIDSGLRFGLELKRLSQAAALPTGWECALGVENSGNPFGGDFGYRLYRFSAGYSGNLGRRNYLSAVLKAVTSHRRLPPHKLYSLGDNIRGVDTFEKDFDLFQRRGDRMWYLQLGWQRLINPPDNFITRLVYNWAVELYFSSGVTFLSTDDTDPLTLFTEGLDHLENGIGAGVSFTFSRTRVGICLEQSLNSSYRHGPYLSLRLEKSR
jgi:hypothetical protein